MDGAHKGIDLGIFYRLAPAFLVGVGAGIYGLEVPLCLLLAAALAGMLVASSRGPSEARPWLLLSLLLSVSVAAGLLRGILARPSSIEPPEIARFDGKTVRAAAEVIGAGRSSARGVRAVVRVSTIELVNDGESEPSPEKIAGGLLLVLDVKREKNAWIYSPGARFSVYGQLRRPVSAENPGVHSYRDYLARQGIFGILHVWSPRGARVTRWPEGWQPRLSRKASYFSRWVNETAGEGGALVTALAVGDRSGVDEKLTQDLRSSGTSHILAISGLHVGIAGVFFFFLIRTLLLRSATLTRRLPVRKIAILIALAGVALYAVLSGYSDATRRAALMLGSAALALTVDRRISGRRAILLAAAWITASDPPAVAGISFQLSFAAAAAIVLAFEALGRAKDRFSAPSEDAGFAVRVARKLGRAAQGIALASLAANLATAPLAAYYFNRLTLNGLFANFLVLPVVEFVLLPASLVTLGLWWLSPRVALPVLHLSSGAGRLVQEIAAFFARHFPLDAAVGSPTSSALAIYYAALLALVLGVIYRRSTAVVGGAATLGLLALVFFLPRGTGGDALLEVQRLDVGPRSVTLARWPDGRTALMDATRFSSDFPYAERTVIPVLAAAGVRKVDLLLFAARGAHAADALAQYQRALSVKEVWDYSSNLPLSHRRWPEESGKPLLEIFSSGRKPWAAVLSGGRGKYVLVGEEGYWPGGWIEEWQRTPVALQLGRGGLSSRSARWLTDHVRPRVLLLPRESKPEEKGLVTRWPGEAASGGWSRVTFDGKGAIRLERKKGK